MMVAGWCGETSTPAAGQHTWAPPLLVVCLSAGTALVATPAALWPCRLSWQQGGLWSLRQGLSFTGTSTVEACMVYSAVVLQPVLNVPELQS